MLEKSLALHFCAAKQALINFLIFGNRDLVPKSRFLILRPERCRFSGAVDAEKAEALLILDGKVEVVDRAKSSVIFDQFEYAETILAFDVLNRIRIGRFLICLKELGLVII